MVHEVDPLSRPKCGGTMQIVSFPPKEEAPLVELAYEPCYDDLPFGKIF